MKKIVAFFLALAIVLSLSSCHTHVWQEATCTAPRTCVECGATEGEPLGHTWAEATCTVPKTCTVCGKTEGTPLEHTVAEWTVVKEPSCTVPGAEQGTCSVCGQNVERTITRTEHTPGDWIVTEAATIDKEGTHIKKCTVCGEVLLSENYSMTPEEKQQAMQTLQNSTASSQLVDDTSDFSMLPESTGFSYYYDWDINGYVIYHIGSCTDDPVIIPRYIGEKPVRKVNLSYEGEFHTLVIPENVRILGNVGSIGLEKVYLPKSLYELEYNAFYGCSKISEIVIPYGVRKIGTNAFSECANLKSITLPSSLYQLEGPCFQGDKNLTDIYYQGSKADWSDLQEGIWWELQGVTIHCSDGDIRGGY